MKTKTSRQLISPAPDLSYARQTCDKTQRETIANFHATRHYHAYKRCEYFSTQDNRLSSTQDNRLSYIIMPSTYTDTYVTSDMFLTDHLSRK